jgi:multidrug transporter EmrE-like cation transporter
MGEPDLISRTAITILLFTVYVITSSTGLLLFKHHWPNLAHALSRGNALGQSIVGPLAGVVLYATSFLLWLAIVSRMPLTIAYPIAIGLSLVAVMLGAAYWLGEALNATHIAGALLVFAGVVLLTR